jgi:hypothetical protein
MKRMRIATLIAALALAALTGVAAGSSPSPPPSTVACDTVIEHTKFPYASSGYRLVLDVVSVPPGHLPNVYPTRSRPWVYWRKAGLVVRADRGPILVSVAKAWRTRVAIRWGGAGARRLVADRTLFDQIRGPRQKRKRDAENGERVCGRVLPPLALGLRAAHLPCREPKRERPLRPRATLRRGVVTPESHSDSPPPEPGFARREAHEQKKQ